MCLRATAVLLCGRKLRAHPPTLVGSAFRSMLSSTARARATRLTHAVRTASYRGAMADPVTRPAQASASASASAAIPLFLEPLVEAETRDPSPPASDNPAVTDEVPAAAELVSDLAPLLVLREGVPPVIDDADGSAPMVNMRRTCSRAFSARALA